MKKLLMVLTALLWTGTITYAAPPTEAQKLICEYTQWKGCSEVTPPTIIVTRNMPRGWLGGYWPEEPYIFIRAGQRPEDMWETEVHETIHYLRNKLGIYGHPCDEEGVARGLTAIMLNTEYDYTWPLRYVVCQKGQIITLILRPK